MHNTNFTFNLNSFISHILSPFISYISVFLCILHLHLAYMPTSFEKKTKGQVNAYIDPREVPWKVERYRDTLQSNLNH